ncbi:hypothetical protein HKX48_005796 [Thoreauomyces humboldtii]|nr:hypothetical protein HKX48_005796 [Thoreauomyces humboldtii]
MLQSQQSTSFTCSQHTRPTSSANVEHAAVCLDDFRRFATEFLAKRPLLEALTLNAGIQVSSGTTYIKDGIEATFGVNHVGHALLIALLRPHMAPGGRIVSVASGMHDPAQKVPGPSRVYTSTADLAKPAETSKAGSNQAVGAQRYATSKLGLNHIKLATSSITKSHDFYTRILPFTPLPQFDHVTPEGGLFAKMVQHQPSRILLELRYHPEQAAAQIGWDPVTWGVSTRKDLESWADRLKEEGVSHSKVLMGLRSWVLVCEDPDGRKIRFYVEDEVHEWTDRPDEDEHWLGKVLADPQVQAGA